MVTQSLKRIFYEDSDFKLEVDDYQGKLLLHCIVTNWKPSALRRGYSKFVQLEQYARDCGYAQMITATPNPAFVRLFGGTTVQRFEYEDILYEVVVWDLKQVQ